MRATLTNAMSTLALATLLVGAGPTATDKKPATTPVVTPQKTPATPQDTFEDEPETPVKTEVVPGQAVQKTGAKVLVLPLHPVYRSVAQNKIQMANDLLLKELDQKDLQIVRGGVSKGETTAPSVEGANKATAEAVKAEADREIQKAIAARKTAISEMEKNAAAVDPDEYVAAHHFLARALMWSGEDKAAQDIIDIAARMRPAFVVQPAEFSRLYRKWVQKAAEKAVADRPGELMVRAALPGAQITLDGRPMDVAPVILKKVVPGKHLLGAKIEGVPPFAAIVDVKPAKNDFTVVFANTVGGASVGTVADAIAENAIPKKAVEAAAAAGKEAGAAYVVLGALAKDDDRFHVHTYVVDVAKASIKPLDVVDFDLELLTAESDVLRVVQNIHSVIGAYASTETSVGVIERRINKQPTVNEVAAAPSLAADETAKKTPGDGKKVIRGPVKPLSAGTIEIKDEKNE
jgi:hypothetical protein